MEKTFMSLVSTAFLLCSLSTDTPGCTLRKPGNRERKESGTSSSSSCFNLDAGNSTAAHPQKAA